jgi:site-specific recombinase XerD
LTCAFYDRLFGARTHLEYALDGKSLVRQIAVGGALLSIHQAGNGLEVVARHPAVGSTIRHRLASRSPLFEYLCEKNAVTHNPVKGVERPRTESGEGKTPAIGDHQARELLAAPQEDTIKSKRDRAILSTLPFHALRREELCKLKVRDFQHAREGVPHLRVSGKGGKTRRA